MSEVLVSFINLYHCISPSLLLFNIHVNVVDLPSHRVTSSGSLITIVQNVRYIHTYIASYILIIIFKPGTCKLLDFGFVHGMCVGLP